jgi:C4-dicarboxylate transporter, DctM subunit
MTSKDEQEGIVGEEFGPVVEAEAPASPPEKSILRWVITNLGRLGCLMFVAVAVIITYEVIMRFIFRSPTVWVTEISSLLCIVGSFLLFAYTLQEKGHTRVDFITAMLPPRSVFFLELFTSVLGLVYSGVLTWYGIKMVQSSLLMEEVTQTLQIPLWIPQIFVPIGGGLMFLQLLKFLKKDLFKKRKKMAEGEYSVRDATTGSLAVMVIFIAALFLSVLLLKVEPRLGLLLLFFVLLFNGMPVSFAMGLFGTMGLYYLLGGFGALINVPMTAYASADSILVIAFPLFLLSGTILQAGNIGPRIFNFTNALVRHLPGGIGIASVIFCGIFSAMTGSSVAVAAAVSVIALPEMIKRGYSRKTTIGLLAAGGTLGILFPPSLALIMYSALTFESLGKLFLGALIPGIMLSLMFIAYMVYVGMKDKNIQRDKRASLKEIAQAFREGVGGLIVIAIIMGGIYSGFFTPSEAGAIAVLYSIFLCTVWYRTMKWKMLRESVMKAGRVASMIILIIIGANVTGNLITMSQITQQVLALVNSLAIPSWVYMVIIVIFLIIMGGPLEAVSIMIITVPILYPIITALGFNGLWFGIIQVVVGELALISPPEGINLFILQEIGKATAAEVSRGVIPFLIIMGLFLLLLCVFPSLTTWLPTLVFGAGGA